MLIIHAFVNIHNSWEHYNEILLLVILLFPVEGLNK